MLSVKAITKNQNIRYYFEKDNDYYFKADQAHLIEAFEWQGKGAKQFGLSGQVTLKDFEQVMGGVTPEGAPLGLKKGEAFLHRPGFDLTFSAPKSVSILALIGGDDRLIHLHQTAVTTALDVVEREAQARITVKGKTDYHTTRNLIMAKFIHDTSRAGDPQLHTHAVIANMTHCHDDKWRSLASDLSRQNGFFERIMNDHTYYGLIYRTELAKGLTEMGYEIETINKHGLFEIKGVPEQVLTTFSKRRNQIETAMEAMGYDSFKAYDKATLDTRQSKNPVDRQTLLAEWLKEMAETGWDMAAFQQKAHEKLHEPSLMENTPHQEKTTPVPDSLELATERVKETANFFQKDFLQKMLKTSLDPIKTTIKKIRQKQHELASERLAKEVVNDAITHLSQGTLSVDYTQVMRRAAEYSLGRCRYEALTKAFDGLVQEKWIIPLDEKGITFATEAQVKTEMALISAVTQGKKVCRSLRLKSNLLNKQGMSMDNQVALKTVLTCQDRIVQLNYTAENKHDFLSVMFNTMEEQGVPVKLLLPNAMHANEAKENMQRHSTSLWQTLKKWHQGAVADSVDTVAGFTFKAERNIGQSFEKGVIFVDGAQKLTPVAMNALFEATKKSKTKIILLNESQGIHNNHQSSVMKTLEKAKIHTQALSSTEKLHEKPSVHMTLHAIAEDEARLTAVAHDYVQLPEDQRLNTLVVGQSIREARQLNTVIREGLKNKGQLGRREHLMMTHQPVFLSDSERSYAKHYTTDMVIKTFHHHTWEEMKIITVCLEENSVIVSRANGKKERIACKKLPKGSQIVEEKKRLIAECEKVVVTGNMKKLGLLKGEVWTVKSLHKQKILLEKRTKAGHQTVTLSLSDLEKSAIDYHYTESLSQLREEKIDCLFTALKSRAVNQESLQALSRKSDHLVIYTNDVEKAEKRFNVIPEKTTVIDAILNASHTKTGKKTVITPDNMTQMQQQLADAVNHMVLPIQNPVNEALDFAIAKLSERNAGFEHKELMETAITYALGKVSVHALEANLREKMQSGVLLAGRDETDQTIWTTSEALTLEKEILAGLKRGKNTQKPLMSAEWLKNELDNSPLTEGQKEACHLIGTTKDRFVMVQGYAGTGKSTTLGKLAQLLKAMPMESDGERVKILACAPTHQAVKELAQLGIEAQTIKNLLIDQKTSPQNFSNTLLLLDEDSMEGNRDIHAFQAMVEKSKGRAVYVGDKEQFLSVESGKPKENALNTGAIAVAYMKDIVRQENETIKDAVLDVIHDDVVGALQKIENLNPQMVPREDNALNEDWIARINGLEKSVISAGVPRKDKNGQVIKADQDKEWDIELPLPVAVAQEYLSRPKAVREDTVIIVQTHQDRALVHEAIIDGLMARGEIAKNGLKAQRLVSKRLTRVEARHIFSYASGDFVKMGKGDYLTVVAVQKDSRSLQCQKQDGTFEVIFPEKVADQTPIEIYQKEKAFLSQGMLIKLTKTDKERGILANREWSVLAVSPEIAQLKEKDSGRLFDLNIKELKDQHWDYAYTSTGYGIQGSSCRYVIDLAASYLKHLTNRRAFYITISRAKQHVMLFTDNKKALLDKFFNRGDKYSALEVTGDIKKASKRLKNTLKPHENGISPDHQPSSATADYADWEALQASADSPDRFNQKPQKTGQKSAVKTVRSSVFNSIEKVLKKPYFEAERVEKKLRDQAETVLVHIVGKQNPSSTNAHWKYGSNQEKGSLNVNMQGDKKGLWYDFDNQEGGGMITLIEKQLGLPFKEALEYGAYLVGELPTTNYQKKDAIPPFLKEKTETKKENKTRETALKLIKESRPIAGTLAENYLKNTRKIEQISCENLRFLPQVYTGTMNKEIKKYSPALLTMAKDSQGNVQSVQVTYLDSKTVNKADFPIKKRTYGSPNGACVMLQKGQEKARVTYLTEGAETGLSVANASPQSRVLVTLGKANFSKISPDLLTEKVVFCLDNDGYHTFTKSLLKAAENLEKEGKKVGFVMPEKLKNDFNDVLKNEGLSAVESGVNQEITSQQFKEMTHFCETLNEEEKRLKQLEVSPKNPTENGTNLTMKAFKEKAEERFKTAVHALFAKKASMEKPPKDVTKLNHEKAVKRLDSTEKMQGQAILKSLQSKEKTPTIAMDNPAKSAPEISL